MPGDTTTAGPEIEVKGLHGLHPGANMKLTDIVHANIKLERVWVTFHTWTTSRTTPLARWFASPVSTGATALPTNPRLTFRTRSTRSLP